MMRRKRLLLVEASAAAAPLVVLALLRAGFSPGPAPVAASPAPEAAVAMPAAPAKPAPPPTPRQLEAVAWADTQDLTALRSPMDHPRPKPPEPPPTVTAAADAASGVDPLAGLRPSALMGGSDGGLAVIAGKIRKPGEEVAPGVTLVAVDARLNTVTFRLADGTERTLEKPDARPTPRR